MFTGLKRTIGHRVLKKRSRQAVCTRRFHNFHTAKTIGLIYLYTKETDVQIGQFMRLLAERGIKTKAVGYVAEAEIPKSFIITVNKILFCKPQLNWYGRPVASEIAAFIETPFDILIDFSRVPVFPLQYIATLSHAAMRVGRHSSADNPYEFLLAMPDEADSHSYIEQLTHYLLSIQTK
ncbi:MAG: hypothetical protein LBS12_02285 [Prevotellaceae bacterium]|jgi:hypothetical protein|nr:hypothetical protein [Prevotellaceae bacterium]